LLVYDNARFPKLTKTYLLTGEGFTDEVVVARDGAEDGEHLLRSERSPSEIMWCAPLTKELLRAGFSACPGRTDGEAYPLRRLHKVNDAAVVGRADLARDVQQGFPSVLYGLVILPGYAGVYGQFGLVAVGRGPDPVKAQDLSIRTA
jgi:hypothetical protein